MLHNSGPYGPNEVSVNMGASLNSSQIVDQNVHNLSPNSQNNGLNNPIPMIPGYKIPSYSRFNAFSSNLMSPMSDYPGYSYLNPYAHFQQDSLNYDPQVFNMPLNMNAHSSSITHRNNEYNSKILYNVLTNENNDKDESQTKKSDDTMYSQIPPSFLMADGSFADKYDRSKRLERIQGIVKHIENNINNTDNLSKQNNYLKELADKKQNTTTVVSNDKQRDNLNKEQGKIETCLINEKEINETVANIKQSPSDDEDNYDIMVPNVIIKVERLEDNEFNSIFLSDQNGTTKDLIDYDNVTIVPPERSAGEALANLKKDPPTNLYYVCPHCSKLFAHPKRFLIHYKWHSFGSVLMQRQALAEAKERRQAMKRGEVVDDSEANGAFPCKTCGKLFKSALSLKKHRYSVHKQAEKFCSICKVGFPDVKSLKEHHSEAHPTTENGGYNCHVCEKTFKNKTTLAKHASTHREKSEECLQCGKKFHSPGNLKHHIKVAHDKVAKEVKYHCQFCGKGYYDKFNVKIHERSHTNERPFKCEICSTAYSTNSGLKRHLKVSHSSKKPHECNVCHRSFSTETIRDRHQLRAHTDLSEFVYHCTYCPSKYLNDKNLRSHIRKAHPKEMESDDD